MVVAQGFRRGTGAALSVLRPEGAASGVRRDHPAIGVSHWPTHRLLCQSVSPFPCDTGGNAEHRVPVFGACSQLLAPTSANQVRQGIHQGQSPNDHEIQPEAVHGEDQSTYLCSGSAIYRFRVALFLASTRPSDSGSATTAGRRGCRGRRGGALSPAAGCLPSTLLRDLLSEIACEQDYHPDSHGLTVVQTGLAAGILEVVKPMPRDVPAIVRLQRELGERLAVLRKAAGMTQEALARATNRDRTAISHLENGRTSADERFWAHADALCQAGGALVSAFRQFEAVKQANEQQQRDAELAKYQAKASAYETGQSPGMPPAPRAILSDEEGETAALELLRRVTASDVGNETLSQLELIVDDLAVAYSQTQPAPLVGRVQQHLGYVMHLMDARKTLAEHRRLVVVGGWLSLLAATVHIDLNQHAAATARLRTAASLAKHANNRDIEAWCYETEAWRVLTERDYPRALKLSEKAQALAPDGSSIAIQATAQAGRAHARLGQARETYTAIDRVHELAGPLEMPDRPEHHYRYDPAKSMAYTATTLAWLGDPAAETWARQIITQLQPGDGEVSTRPRRVAAANLDLALTLLVTDRLDEACAATQRAIASGRVVPSNYWRAEEVVTAVEARSLPEATELREAYEELVGR